MKTLAPRSDAARELTSHSVLLLEVHGVHLGEVEELEVLAEALALELAEEQRVDARARWDSGRAP